ncbi:MAG: hypothetical protein O3C25_04830 [Chloroflexi bacterium]|nr:hypothetical protein [Chloroflexota bacterium]
MDLTRRGSTGRAGSALVILNDYRAALATTLLLQELDFAVDVAVDEEAVLNWVTQARYDLLLCGPGPDRRPEALAMRLRRATPAARIVMLAPEGSTPADLRPLGIEVLFPPITVNLLMDRLWRAAA